MAYILFLVHSAGLEHTSLFSEIISHLGLAQLNSFAKTWRKVLTKHFSWSKCFSLF